MDVVAAVPVDVPSLALIRFVVVVSKASCEAVVVALLIDWLATAAVIPLTSTTVKISDSTNKTHLLRFI
jgi:hypothetical protein